ncbi:nucleoporin protein Ndc1-Nup [Syncephalastrum racemosum]|uniref:Nucleoporin protein Ndc1-Nup n=1 Tax=Syncephalastrum racemosum TaxID=13706 RepID=A0A1X2H7B2_SYNRA|nr:nucleoporin protein Ndc1-Nup [Syncephalastrum racemosum]
MNSLVHTLLYSILLFLPLAALLMARISLSSVWEPIPPSDAAETLYKLTRRDHVIVLFMYMMSGAWIVRTYFSYLQGETYLDNFFIYPHGQRFGTRQMNQDNLFITVYGLALGVYALISIWHDTWKLQMLGVQQPKAMALKLSLATVVHDGGKFAFHVFCGTYVVFMFFNGTIYRLAAYILSVGLNMLDTPVVGFSWLDLYLFFRMLLAGTLASSCFQAVDRVFNVFFSAVEPISAPYANAHACLLSGLREREHRTAQSLAYAELAQIANKDPERRVAIFQDITKEQDGTAYERLSKECIHILSMLRADIEKEYTGAAPKVAPKPATPLATTTSPNRIQVLDQDVLAAPKTNHVVLDDRTGSLFTYASTLAEPHLTQPHPPVPKQRVFKILQWLEARVQRWGWYQRWLAVTAVRKTRSLFSHYPVLMWATQALGNLTAASYKEDPYGLVQRDISNVLDELLATLIAIEKFLRTPPAAVTKLASTGSGKVMLYEPEVVLLALRDSIYNITTTFRDYMDQFPVRSEHAAKLNEFLQFTKE